MHILLRQEQNRLRQWINVRMGLKAETDQGKTVTRPQFAARRRFLLPGI